MFNFSLMKNKGFISGRSERKSNSLTMFGVPDFIEIRSVISEEKYYLPITCSFYDLFEMNAKLLLKL